MITPKKRKKDKKSKKYFTHIHEQAILDYVGTTDPRTRNELYVEIIRPALVEMIEKILYKFKFTNLPNSADLVKECEAHLVCILNKFDVSRGFMAFSYFSVITKNWFTHKAKKHSQQIKKETQCEDLSKNIEIEYLSTQNEYIESRITQEFLESFKQEINIWETLNLKPNELKVIKAIKILFNYGEDIDIFNKKYIYNEIKDITNLNTKQLLASLNKLRKMYMGFRNNWFEEIS